MTTEPKITYNGALVLVALARGYRYGFEIMDFTGLASGTAYPILRRFESMKLARSRWEQDESAQEEGRPRRRNYELTALGRKALDRAIERLEAHQRIFSDAVRAESGRSR